MTDPERRYHLALRELHAAAGARFGVAGSWSLPFDYGDAAAEHAALRGNVALFDRSHRSRVMVTGTDAETVLREVYAGHVEELEEGRAMRTAWLDGRGEIRDLALVMRTGGIAYLVSGEPGQRAATVARLNEAAGPDYDVRIDDRTETTCTLAVAGPGAADFVRQHLADGLPARLQSLQSVTFEFHGFRTMATRTSDTGEDGFEFVVAPAVAQHIIETLRGAGAPLVGRIALEAARVEAAIPAYDPDLSPGLSPAEADLDQLLAIPGGRERRILAAVLVDGPPVAPGTPVDSGEMRSCLHSYALGATIGLAILDATTALPGRTVSIDGASATVVAKPFYRRRS